MPKSISFNFRIISFHQQYQMSLITNFHKNYIRKKIVRMNPVLPQRTGLWSIKFFFTFFASCLSLMFITHVYHDGRRNEIKNGKEKAVKV